MKEITRCISKPYPNNFDFFLWFQHTQAKTRQDRPAQSTPETTCMRKPKTTETTSDQEFQRLSTIKNYIDLKIPYKDNNRLTQQVIWMIIITRNSISILSASVLSTIGYNLESVWIIL